MATVDPDRRVRVWDLPTRLFHWSLVVLVAFSVVTAKAGGNAMEWHMKSGYAILTLIVFRILWGLAGSRYALFAQFVVARRDLLAAHAIKQHAGHNPLGGWAVIAMLLMLGTQGATGLFANDDIATEGPWAKFVSSAASAQLTTLHRYGEKALYGLVALHLAAIAYYYFAQRENLVAPMWTGDKLGIDAEPAEDGVTVRVRAAVFATLAAGLIGYLVSL